MESVDPEMRTWTRTMESQSVAGKKTHHSTTGLARNDSGIVRFDLHLHSHYSSDSTIPVHAIVQSWQQTGILPLVCDHNTIAGSVHVFHEIRRLDPDIPKVLAEEVLTSEGEIIGLFLQDEIPQGLSADETLDEIRDQGAVSIVPHPFCSFRSSVIRPDVLDRIVDRIDIVEGFNGRAASEEDNLCARRYAVLHKKPVSAGSDAHTPQELGQTFIEMQPFSSPREFIRAIRSPHIHYRRSQPFPQLLSRPGPDRRNAPELVS
jgi:predicted metal-dependent phosphoesterase TrpH